MNIRNWYKNWKKEIDTCAYVILDNLTFGGAGMLYNLFIDKEENEEEIDEYKKKYNQAMLQETLEAIQPHVKSIIINLNSSKEFNNLSSLEGRIKYIKNSKYKEELDSISNDISSTLTTISQKVDTYDIKKKVGNKYLLEDKLGEGGQGEVYKATDININDYVALKLLPKELSQDLSGLESLKIEYKRLINKLTHPFIVQYRNLDFCNNEQRWFISMDYIHGRTLRTDLIRQKHSTPFTISQVYDILFPVASALDYAHNNKIVHADVKPANILRSSSDQTYLTDFGLSHEIQETLSMYTNQSSSIRGTYPYMSPEQFKGKHPKPESDIWALSVIIYEMLTLEKPFSGKSFDHLKNVVCTEEPEIIHSLEQWDVLKMGLEKDYNKRISSATQLLQLLHPEKSSIQLDSMLHVEKKDKSLLEEGISNYKNYDYQKAFEAFNQLTAHPDSYYYLGNLYLYGKGTPKNISKAINYLEKGSNLNNDKCNELLGLIYMDTTNPVFDVNKSLKYFKNSLTPQGMIHIGNLYMLETPLQDYKKSIYWYKEALKNNNYTGHYHLGYLHEHGLGVAKRYKNAFKEYQLGIEQNDTQSMIAAAQMLLTGKGVVKKNIDKALNYLSQAAELKNTFALNLLGQIYLEGKHLHLNHLKGIKYYEASAELHNIDAMDAIAEFYMRESITYFKKLNTPTEHVVAVITDTTLLSSMCSEAAKCVSILDRHDHKQIKTFHKDIGGIATETEKIQVALFEKGVYWLEKAAYYFDTNAMIKLGTVYEHLNKVHEAEQWYVKAVHFNDHSATIKLADFYKRTSKINEHIEKAIIYYKKGCQQGNYTSAYKLARIYEKDKNRELSEKYYLEYLNLFPHPKNSKFYYSKVYEKLGTLYLNTIENTNRDYDIQKSVEWYKKAIEYENYDAYYMLGVLYKYNVTENNSGKESIKYFTNYINNYLHEEGEEDEIYEEKVLEAYEYIAEIYAFGLYCEKNINKAKKYYEKAYQFSKVAQLYEEENLSKKNIKKIIKYYEMDENYDAIASIYYQGILTTKDMQKALEYYKKSDSTEALVNIGKIYYELGNNEKANSYYEQATEKSEVGSLLLAQMYENGNYIKKDHKKAIEHYTLAAEHDCIKSLNALSRIYREGIMAEVNLELSSKYENKAKNLKKEIDEYAEFVDDIFNDDDFLIE